MRRRYCSTLPVLAAALVLAACTQLEDSPAGPANDGETVFVPIHLAVAPTETVSSFAGLTGESPATKTDYEPEAPGYDADAAIKTLTVMQFEKDETGDGYTRVGNLMTYDYEALENHTENIALKVSARKNIIFVLANAAGLGLDKIPLEGHTTLVSFLESQNSSQLGTLDSVWFQPPGGGADRYLRMSAALELADGVTLGTNIGTDGNKLELKRNCAKIVARIKNGSSGPDAVTLKGVQLCDISKEYHYVTNYTGFEYKYSPQVSRRFDDTEKVFPDDGVVDGEYRTYTWYVPVNERGTIINSVQGNKNRQAPVGATHLCIYAVDGSGNHITYTYYLGENLTNDFNLKPNRKYTYTIDIQGKGDPATDSRVEHMDEIVFASDANSYMLKPPTGAGQTRTYKIPVRRAAVFWNAPGTNMGVYGAEVADDSVAPLTESTPWTASFVWNEITDGNGAAVPDDQILIGASGKGFNPVGVSTVADHQPFIRIMVEPGMKGIALVAIKVNDVIVWSWLLWVTDYDPYVQMTPVDGTYIYGVPGGEIHRYRDKDNNTKFWGSNGTYAGGFIMDRNLGAGAVIASDLEPETVSFGPYFQWGRKDPFKIEGSVEYVQHTATGQPGHQNIRYSVHNPKLFLATGNWTGYETSGYILGVEMGEWNDPKTGLHGEDNCEPDKSIYDPCPYGWKIPRKEAWSDYRSFTVSWVTDHLGGYYYPEGYNPLAPKGRVFYPAAGVRYNGSGELTSVGVVAWIWSANLSSEDYGYSLDIRSGAVTMDPFARAAARPVRCIRVDYRRPY